jgi:hypothetical protein
MKAAIELLTSALTAIKEKAPDEPILKDFEQAIHVLEAAEKIDKGETIHCLCVLRMWFLNEVGKEERIDHSTYEIAALLESLPDKEPE